MMLARTAKQLERLIVDNSPTIMTAIGVVGSVTTAYLTGKASFTASKIIAKDALISRPYANENETWRNTKLVWKEYIPAVSSGAVTIAAIICANRISARRAAAMAIAYGISEKKYEEFKEKAYEKLTPAKQQAVQDELAQNRINQNPLSNQSPVIIGTGKVICFDLPTGRYFESNVEALRKAENDINSQVIHDGSCPLSDFYTLIGLKETPYSEAVGWTEEKMMELSFSTCLTEENQPCVVIDYNVIPIRGYKRPSDEDI